MIGVMITFLASTTAFHKVQSPRILIIMMMMKVVTDDGDGDDSGDDDDLKNLITLYPDIPRDSAFGKYYSYQSVTFSSDLAVLMRIDDGVDDESDD